jgi:hypothetical protein
MPEAENGNQPLRSSSILDGAEQGPASPEKKCRGLVEELMARKEEVFPE